MNNTLSNTLKQVNFVVFIYSIIKNLSKQI